MQTNDDFRARLERIVELRKLVDSGKATETERWDLLTLQEYLAPILAARVLKLLDRSQRSVKWDSTFDRWVPAFEQEVIPLADVSRILRGED